MHMINLGDVMHNSVWKDTHSLPGFPRLKGDTKTDVLIVGGGLAGILTASMLRQAGIDYLLIEADRICSGVTRNTTAKITSQHGLIYSKLMNTFDADTARLYWEANEAALGQYRELAKLISCDLEERDSYVYSLSRPDRIEQELSALDKLRIPAEYTDKLPLPFPVTGSVKFKGQAQFHPLKFVSGIAQSLNIREHTRALEFKGEEVRTNRGNIRASKIIITTHFPVINKHGSYFLKLYQDRSYVLALAHAPDLDGMYIDEAETGLSFRNYGGLLLLGGSSHRTGKPSGGWSTLETFAKEYYPDAAIQYHWATQDCMSLDDLPYIGQYSAATPNLYVASGFNKWGMTSSMLAANILRDALLDKPNPYSCIFSPSRSMLHPQLLKNVAETTASMFTFSKPRCPHLGCALKWNRQEHSWDCPCHGSRFTEHGTLLDNPATSNMKREHRR